MTIPIAVESVIVKLSCFINRWDMYWNDLILTIDEYWILALLAWAVLRTCDGARSTQFTCVGAMYHFFYAYV